MTAISDLASLDCWPHPEMHARGIPPPPGFEGVARPVRVPAGAGRQALPLQVPALASAAPALLHHVHQPSYLPHTHAQIPVRPPMTMHDAVRALSDRTRAYLRADRKTERVCARTRFGRQRLTHAAGALAVVAAAAAAEEDRTRRVRRPRRARHEIEDDSGQRSGKAKRSRS